MHTLVIILDGSKTVVLYSLYGGGEQLTLYMSILILLLLVLDSITNTS
jgi:hypothetical protein